MPTITTTVRYVNPPKPGKKRGSIKCDGDRLLGVFADKMDVFHPGQTYEIDYTVTEANGVTYENVKSAKLVGGASPAAASASHNGGGSYRETSPRDAERMFVCSLLNAAIQSGRVEFKSDELGYYVRGLRKVWASTFGSDDAVPQQRAMNQ